MVSTTGTVITECLRLAGTFWDHWSDRLLQAGSPKAGCPWLCLLSFLISLKMETLQPLWTISSILRVKIWFGVFIFLWKFMCFSLCPSPLVVSVSTTDYWLSVDSFLLTLCRNNSLPHYKFLPRCNSNGFELAQARWAKSSALLGSPADIWWTRHYKKYINLKQKICHFKTNCLYPELKVFSSWNEVMQSRGRAQSQGAARLSSEQLLC